MVAGIAPSPDALAAFEQERPELSRLAYRMLGSRTDADDILQEAWLRWTRGDRTGVDTPRAFLTTIVTRLCIDRRREIDARKETYIGPWLPEPYVSSASHAEERAETISMAFLYVLERLSPLERAAYLLRRVFDYDYADISRMLEKSPESCRQLVSRAERHVAEGKPRFEAEGAEASRIGDEFLAACATGDLSRLMTLMSPDVVMVSDGGGKATAALRPIHGADRVARFFVGITKKIPPDGRAEPILVNGHPGLAAWIGEKLVAVYSFDILDGRIEGVYVLRNPDKLAGSLA
jgi:RNA polymerase sigma-70 factor (ECF subfamily)